MAEFDVFRSYPAPQIDTRLFSDTFSQGVAAGKQVPSTTSAIIQGVQQGLDRGLDVTQKVQQSVLRANEIQQLPVANELQQEQLENARITNDINQMRLELDRATEKEKLEKTRLDMQAQLSEAKLKLQDTTNEAAIIRDLGSNNPLVRGSVLHNKDYTGTLLRDKDLATSVLGRLSQDPALSPEDRKLALSLGDYYKNQELELKRQEAQTKAIKETLGNFPEAQKSLDKSYGAQRVLNEFGIRDRDLDQVEIYPEGVKTFNPDGTMKDVPDKDISILTPKGFVAVYKGKKSNTLLDNSDADAVTGYQSILRKLSGDSVRGGQVAAATPTPSATPSPSPTPQPNSQPFLGEFREGMKQAGTALANSAKTFGLDRLLPREGPGVIGPAPYNPNPTPPAGPALVETDNPTVRRREAELIAKAERDPRVMERLKAKGLLKEDLPQTPPSGSALPSAVPTPTPQPTTAPVLGGEGAGGGGAGGPVPQSTPLLKKQTVEEVHASLPAPVKKNTEVEILSKVNAEPLLSGLDPLYKAVAAVESGGKRSAKAKGSSAEGLFQLTTGAAKDVGVNRKDPKQNVRGGVAYLNQQLETFSGNTVAALFGYRLGAGVIKDAIETVGSSKYEDIVLGLRYLQERGLAPKYLTKDELEKAAKYPAKVLAYRQAFEAIGSG